MSIEQGEGVRFPIIICNCTMSLGAILHHCHICKEAVFFFQMNNASIDSIHFRLGAYKAFEQEHASCYSASGMLPPESVTRDWIVESLEQIRSAVWGKNLEELGKFGVDPKELEFTSSEYMDWSRRFPQPPTKRV